MPDSIGVLLDCTALPANRGGVGRYIEGLLPEFPPDKLRLVIVAQERDARDFAAMAPSAEIVTVPKAYENRVLRILWEQFGLPRRARRLRVDVVHSPHYTFPLLSRMARVVTVHDATFFSDPKVHSLVKRLFFQTWTKLAWRMADAVIVPSAATASEVERFLGRPRATVTVAFHGVDAEVFTRPTESQVASFRESIGLQPSDQWISFLGTIEPRKNLVSLIRAHQVLNSTLGSDCPMLLISGARGWDQEAAELLDSLDDTSGVRELGYLPLEDLPSLLGGSRMVVYPSLGEGFGLPVLEAMACGAVVVTTRRLALPEVGGDAVAYTEPDTSAIEESMRRLLADDAMSAELRDRAIERASLLTWKESSRLHMNAYRQASEAANG